MNLYFSQGSCPTYLSPASLLRHFIDSVMFWFAVSPVGIKMESWGLAGSLDAVSSTCRCYVSGMLRTSETFWSRVPGGADSQASALVHGCSTTPRSLILPLGDGGPGRLRSATSQMEGQAHSWLLVYMYPFLSMFTKLSSKV